MTACPDAPAILALTKSLLDEFGPRPAGSPSCLAAARRIAGLLSAFCDTVTEERFETQPGSFNNLGRIVAVCYCVSAVMLTTGGAVACGALAVCLTGLAYTLVQFVFMGDFFDPLFAKAKGCNVAGTIEPAGEVRRQVVIVGHHDSPYVLSLLERFQELAVVRLVLAIVSYVFLTTLCAAAVVRQVSGSGWSLHGVLFACVCAGLALTAPLFFLITTTPSPGAGDNLNATAIAVKVGEHFALQRRERGPLAHTRLVLLSTDAEEPGQRGAAAFCRRHREELQKIPTRVLVFDSVFALRDLTVLTRDRNATLPLSGAMVRDLMDIARCLGVPLKKAAIPMGGTDAVPFAGIGVEAASIIGVSPPLFGKSIVYHTTRDTVENIQPEAVQAVFDIAVEYVERLDGNIS
jgi:aminopeptidase YwaD